jgi:hypothetical protein
MVVWNLTPSSQIEPQLTDSSDLVCAQRASGLLHLTGARVSIPTAAPGAPR